MQKSILFNDFSRELKEIRSEIDLAIARVLDRGWFVLGPEGEAFEGNLGEFCRVKHAIGVANATDGITLALMAVGIQPGDEVITVANTCIPTATGILRTGATVKIADVDPNTLEISLDSIRKTVTSKTKAIIPVHLYGNACAIREIRDFCDANGFFLIEDCAQAIGTEVAGQMVGSFGHIGVLSFYPTKNLGAYGDGGALLTQDSKLADRIKMLRNYGKSDRETSQFLGMNCRLDEIQAAILGVKLTHLKKWTERRREIASIYQQELKALVQFPSVVTGVYHTYHLLPLLVKKSMRNALRDRLNAAGVQAYSHYPVPLHLQPGLRGLGYKQGDFPHAESACDQVITLPIYPQLTDREVHEVVKIFKEEIARCQIA